jgi:hypothetical protein
MNIFRIFTLTLIPSLWFTSAALAQERKIERSDLPPKVEEKVATLSEGATIRGFSKERENGQTDYEVEMVVDGHSKDVLMDSGGTALEVEEQVTLDSLPLAVQRGLQTKAGKGKLIKVECITKHDKVVAYEAQVRNSGKGTEVQVSPDGKPLSHEE